MASDSDTLQSSPLVPGEGTHSSVHLDGVFAPSPAGGLPPAPARPRPHRNLKKLSLTIPATPTSSGPATASFLPSADKSKLSAQPKPVLSLHPPTRRASIVSLPPISSAALYRKDEVESPSVPYRDGPIQVIPHLWIGDEDNARDWKSLWERGIKSILNVAKELPCSLQHQSNPLRCAQSTSNLGLEERSPNVSTYYPPHLPSGRPGFHYLKLPWSHGQTNLVKDGFPAAMQFVDEAIARGDGVLVHCQCGVSRSATLVIALVMRAAISPEPTIPPDITALKGGGMHAAYAFVKEKSKWIGPNMSLIYQLLDYERTLQSGNASPSSSLLSNHEHDDTDIGRHNRVLDEQQPEQGAGADNPVFAHEAKALDQEMEERKVARKSSQLSVASSSSGMGAAPIWRSRYGFPALGRNRTGSISSNRSGFSEDIQEEGEEDVRFSSGASPSTMATDEDAHGWPKDVGECDQTITVGVPAPKLLVSIPAAPTHKSSFNSISRTRLKGKSKHRPPPLVNLLPPVPSSPLPAAIPIHDPPCSTLPTTSPSRSIVSSMPSGHLDNRRLSRSSVSSHSSIRSSSSAWSSLQTPSQTLLIFPSEDSGGGSTVMLTATPAATAFPVLPSRRPNLSTRKPCLQLGTVSTPTTAFSFVEVKGTNTTSQVLKRQA